MRKSYWFAYRLFFASLTYLCCTLPAQATVIEAEGVAKLEFKTLLSQTRELALQDAKDHALMQVNAEAKSSYAANQNELASETGETRIPTIGKMTILREWQDGDSFHVRIAVVLEQSGDATTVNQKYRKKVVFTPFHIQKSYQAEDIDGISDGFPKELLRRMETQGKFLTRISPYPISSEASESMGASQDKNLIKQVASMTDSQFLISGDVIDVGNSEVGGFLGFFKHKRRRFDVEVFVYDGLSGEMLARHEIQEFADGDVSVEPDRTIASTSFFSTIYGQAISKAIDTASALISWDLEDIPLTARVIRIVDGKIYIDAGSKSSMTAGDKMLAYKLDALWVNELGANADVGAGESLIGTISIVQVEPMYSICKIQESSSNLKMRVGDLVRVVSADQRNSSHGGSE